jgi:pyridoxine 5-phosphate synthase
MPKERRSPPRPAPSKGVRLLVNVDHVATLRQARRGREPDPVAWALAAEAAGAQGITCHLRQDRRHIQDEDVRRLRAEIKTLLNLETSLEPEMVALALESGAEAICIVPENRQEITTEGGLDARAERRRLAEVVPAFADCGALVSLFVDPEVRQLETSAELGAPFVELHTGAYATAEPGSARERELDRLARAAQAGRELGLRINMGHGLDYDNVAPVARIAGVEELNIGHAIVARSVFAGVEAAVRGMLERIAAAARSGGRA